MSKYGILFGPYFPVFRINIGKYGPEITPHLDTFQSVYFVFRHRFPVPKYHTTAVNISGFLDLILLDLMK